MLPGERNGRQLKRRLRIQPPWKHKTQTRSHLLSQQSEKIQPARV